MRGVTPILRSGVQWLSEIPCVFDALRWILEGGYHRHRRLLANHLVGSAQRVLDCGCGTGIYASCFSPRNYVGVDLSSTYITRARRRFPAYDFQVMDGTNLAFADNSFDAVMVSGVVHHLDEATTARLLSEIARVLQPNGRLLLWEDVPTRGTFNFIGRVVHHLDVGAHIRDSSELERLLHPHFQVEAAESLRSGFMDYTAFRAVKAAAVSTTHVAVDVLSSSAASADSSYRNRALSREPA